MDALSDYKYLCTNIKNAGNVIAFPAFFHIFAFKERKVSLQDILAYIIHSGFISGYQNRYGDNLKPPTNVYHRMTA